MRESNTRLIKWSDGSFTLHIGNDAFDIQTVDSSSGGFAGLNGYVYLSQTATFDKKKETRAGDDDDEEEDETNGGTVLECIGPVTSRLVAKPSSLQSEAHKSLTVTIRQRTIKTARIAEYVTEEDPEKAKLERIKYNEDVGKQNARKRSTGATSHGGAGGGRRNNPGMNRHYLEASDEEGYDTTNIRALKKGSKYDMVDEMDDYGEESDDDYDDTFASRNRKRPRKPQKDAESEEEEEEMVFDDNDDEEVVNVHKKKKASHSHAAVLDDDE